MIKPEYDWCVWLEDRYGTHSAPLVKKEKYHCPKCGSDGSLTKKPDTGEGVKHCKKCGSGWFILETSRGE